MTTVRKRLRRLITLTVVLVLALTALGTVAVLILAGRINELDTRIAPANTANVQTLQSMTDIETGVRGYLLTHDPAFLAPVDRGLVEVPAALQQLDASLADSPALMALVAAERNSSAAWLRDFARPIAERRDAQLQVSTAAQQDAKREFDAFRTDNAALGNALSERRQSLLALVRRRTTGAAVILIGGALAGLAVAILLGRRIIREVAPPLVDLSEVVGRWRGGDRAARADEEHGVIEVRDVARGFNALTEENTAVLADIAERNRLAEAVRTIGRYVGETLAADDVTDRTVGPVLATLEADAIWMRTFQGRGEAPGRGHGAWLPEGDRRMSPPPAITALAARIAAQLWERHEALRLPSAEDSSGIVTPDEEAEILEYTGQVGIDSLVVSPLGAGKECLGYLVLGRSPNSRRWSVLETSAMVQMGRDIGRAILHARLFEREQDLVTQVSALDRQKSEFVSMVSHELRTPITSISGYLELVRHGDVGEVPPEIDEMLTIIERNTQRLRQLIEDLLILSRIESATLRTETLPVDLRELCTEARAVVSPLAGSRQVTVEIESRPEPLTVLGDHGQLERVVNNLLTNAVKFSHPGGRVQLRLSESEGCAVLECEDHGIGIPAGDKPKLFTQFYRASNATAQAVPGTGLGLTIVRSIVVQHGGSVEIHSVEDRGTTARIRIPLAPSATAAPVVDRH